MRNRGSLIQSCKDHLCMSGLFSDDIFLTAGVHLASDKPVRNRSILRTIRKNIYVESFMFFMQMGGT